MWCRWYLPALPAGEKFSSVLTQLAGGGHVPIEGLAGDVELLAECCDAGFGLAHRRHRQAHLGRGHLERSTTLASAGPRRLETGLRPFRDQLTFELSQGREDPEDELALGGRRVHRCALSGQYFESDFSGGEVVDNVDQVAYSIGAI